MRTPVLAALYVAGAALALVASYGAFIAPLSKMDFAGLYWGSSYAQPYAGLLPAGQFFLYPPTALPISSALRLLPYLPALVLLQVAGLLLLWRAARVPWWMVLTPATILCVGITQIGTLMSALWFFAFRGSVVSGALLTLKPNFGALYLFEALRQRNAGKVTGIVLAAVALTLIAFGPGMWLDWWRQGREFGAVFAAGTYGLRYINASSTLAFGWVGWAVLAAFALWRCARSFDLTTATFAAPLVAPYLLVYDLPAVCIVAAQELSKPHRRSTQAALIAVFLAPALTNTWDGVVPASLALALAALASEGQGPAPA